MSGYSVVRLIWLAQRLQLDVKIMKTEVPDSCLIVSIKDEAVFYSLSFFDIKMS